MLILGLCVLNSGLFVFKLLLYLGLGFDLEVVGLNLVLDSGLDLD